MDRRCPIAGSLSPLDSSTGRSPSRSAERYATNPLVGTPLQLASAGAGIDSSPLSILLERVADRESVWTVLCEFESFCWRSRVSERLAVPHQLGIRKTGGIEHADATSRVLHSGYILLPLLVPTPFRKRVVGKRRTVVVAEQHPFTVEHRLEQEVGRDSLSGASELAIARPVSGEPL